MLRATKSTSLSYRRLDTVYGSSSHPLHLQLLRRVDVSHPPSYRTYTTATENLPRVTQPTLWHSLVPKYLRNSDTSRVPAKSQRSKEWNPATFFIWIFLLIGSNAIQMLALMNDYSAFSRKADAKIKLLRDVLDRVQRGEDVDVEKVLGTGDEKQEQEWKDVVRSLEEQAQMWQIKERRGRKPPRHDEQEAEPDDAEKDTEPKVAGDTATENSKPTSKSAKQSDFY